ncbi:MAG: hypothetical protein K8J31_15790, partial [Anaerolineae bacterium]|nr:hypothetical protein [Anaerolineae bacterium]
MIRSLVITRLESGPENLVFQRNLGLEKLTQVLADGESVIWIDITDPAAEEINWLETTLRLHPA